MKDWAGNSVSKGDRMKRLQQLILEHMAATEKGSSRLYRRAIEEQIRDRVLALHRTQLEDPKGLSYLDKDELSAWIVWRTIATVGIIP